MKKVNNNKAMSVTGKGTKGKRKSGMDLITELTTELINRTTEIPAPSAPVIPAPVSAPVIPAPSAPSAPVMGIPNLTSRRINPRAVVRAWRITNNQRKDVFSGGAKYYVQGGEIMIDPLSQRERFEVAIEIPFIDHYAGKVELAKRRSAHSTEVTTEVTKVA